MLSSGTHLCHCHWFVKTSFVPVENGRALAPPTGQKLKHFITSCLECLNHFIWQKTRTLRNGRKTVREEGELWEKGNVFVITEMCDVWQQGWCPASWRVKTVFELDMWLQHVINRKLCWLVSGCLNSFINVFMRSQRTLQLTLWPKGKKAFLKKSTHFQDLQDIASKIKEIYFQINSICSCVCIKSWI